MNADGNHTDRQESRFDRPSDPHSPPALEYADRRTFRDQRLLRADFIVTTIAIALFIVMMGVILWLTMLAKR